MSNFFTTIMSGFKLLGKTGREEYSHTKSVAMMEDRKRYRDPKHVPTPRPRYDIKMNTRSHKKI